MKKVRKVPFFDLSGQHQTLRPEIDAAVGRVLDSGQFILGPPVQELEQEIAAYVRKRFAVGVSSGTDALLLSLMALGVGPGDVVVTTPFSFFATAGTIARLGAIPLLADIEPATFNLDPAQAEKALGLSQPGTLVFIHFLQGIVFNAPNAEPRTNDLR